jgi:MoxR-like ATPase
MLTDVHTINQSKFKELLKVHIQCEENLLVIGPSGGGKTVIAKSVADQLGCDLVYVNLAVMERTDFQGFPVLADDKQSVDYATPTFLCFTDTAASQEISKLERNRSALDESKDKKAIAALDARIKTLKNQEEEQKLINLYNSGIRTPDLEAKVKAALEERKKSRPIVFLFDEVDKAATETNQTLLELLQFKSINGRPLNVKACILTANLPDEHAHSNQISHAISKRCSTYRLDIEFDIWRDWAFKNDVHTHIIQFLSSHDKLLYQPAPDGDATAYALPSPRTWVSASDKLKTLDAMNVPDKDSLMTAIIAGNVGETAAIKFASWYEHYRKWDSAIEDLVEKGKAPDLSKAGAQEVLIVAIAACSKVYTELKPNNDARIKKVVKNVYKWLGTQSKDVQHGAIRISFGGDFHTAYQYGFSKIEESMNIFNDLKKDFEKYK